MIGVPSSPGKGYRWLKLGEKLRKGDEWLAQIGLDLCGWMATSNVGKPAGPCYRYRRKIARSKPRPAPSAKRSEGRPDLRGPRRARVLQRQAINAKRKCIFERLDGVGIVCETVGTFPPKVYPRTPQHQTRRESLYYDILFYLPERILAGANEFKDLTLEARRYFAQQMLEHIKRNLKAQ